MRQVKDFEKYYVHENGFVVSIHKNGRRLLKPDVCNGGYLRVTLCAGKIVKRRMVHRIVAETFIPNPENKPFVNHKNGDKKDNSVSNLEWCTASENEKHAYHSLGKIPPMARKVLDIKTGVIYSSITKAAKAIGVNQSTLHAIFRGQIKTNNTSCQLL